MLARILLVINRSAGTHYSSHAVARLSSAASSFLDKDVELQVTVVRDHQEVAASTTAFLATSNEPAAVIVGGGGGTLRAVVETICRGSRAGHLPGRDQVRIAALRMGSGNALARAFGVPHEPYAALKGIMANLREDRTSPCCIIRCEIGKNGHAGDCRPPPVVRYAATLGGFGQLGRIPRDLGRWHRRLPALHRTATRLLGIERWTHVEYGLALAVRLVLCALQPDRAEIVRVSFPGGSETVQLLAGVLMNFPLKAIPVDPCTRAGAPSLSLCLIPTNRRLTALSLLLRPSLRAQRVRKIAIGSSDRVQIRLIDRDAVDFFLDEDPATVRGQVTIEVAGVLQFVPGSDYHWPEQEGDAHDVSCLRAGHRR